MEASQFIVHTAFLDTDPAGRLMSSSSIEIITHHPPTSHHGHVSSLPVSQVMEIDTGSRQPDRDKEPDTMDTPIAPSIMKDTPIEKGKLPEQAADSTLSLNPDVPAVLEQPKKGGSPNDMQEQSGKASYTGHSGRP